MERQADYVLRSVEERRVRFVQLWFTDILGTLKSFSITPQELENALEEGMRFDGSALGGFRGGRGGPPVRPRPGHAGAREGPASPAPTRRPSRSSRPRTAGRRWPGCSAT